MAWDNNKRAELILDRATMLTAVLLLVVLVACGLEIYAVQPGNQLHPAAALLVLSLAPWIGVFGLASAVLVSVLLVTSGTISVQRSIATPDHENVEALYNQPATAGKWTPSLESVLFDEELMLVAGSECQCPWEELQTELTVVSKDDMGSQPTEEREEYCCASGTQ